MVLNILRGLFVLLMAAAGEFAIQNKITFFDIEPEWMLMITLIIGVLIVCVDILAPRRKLTIFSGTIMGLIVGLLITYGFSFIVSWLVDQFGEKNVANPETIKEYIDLVIAAICCYLATSFILQTKDDFRFIIPYVEFTKQTKGARPILLDTNVLIDGRIADIAETGVLDSRLIVPRFVLSELQTIADSGDKLKRDRGRRGLDVLARLQGNKRTEVILYDSSARAQNGPEDVDAKLIVLASELNSRVLTNDFNLNKVASVRGVDVININDLANALKPVVLPGERMTVRLLKPGNTPGQGVGYLVDGTMVVVEQGRPHLNEEIEFIVTSVLQTSAGKMIFGKMQDSPAPEEARRGHPRRDSDASAT